MSKLLSEFSVDLSAGISPIGDTNTPVPVIVEQYENGVLLLKEKESFGIFLSWENIKEIVDKSAPTSLQIPSPEFGECFEQVSEKADPFEKKPV